ncbi:MAG: hypothetical protein J7K87_02565 [Candidatus Aenigmarchaeota archaeon]|nr:hypothetical protein [Candidatus Aenigmarchaeota archaeon]
MGKITGITYKEKLQLRRCLWGMVNWLRSRGAITEREWREDIRLFDVLKWSDEEVDEFLRRIKIEKRGN